MSSPSAKFKYFLAGAALSLPLFFAYFYGPKSELTLLSRLHYNTLFVYTPCLSKHETYNDGSVKFDYRRPPNLLSHTAVLFIDPNFRAKDPFADATEAASLELPTGYAYKFKLPAGAPVLPPPARTLKLKKGMGEVRTAEPSFKDYGPERLYISGKNGYLYQIELPFYLERIVDRSWFFAAMYHSGILSSLMPGSFTDYMPPRGFFKWFFTPCADKQMYYSGKALIESLEVAD
ncbi:MAG: hypothetical protein ACYC2I_02225 [Elusimicrobiales bacterium]